MFNIGIVDTGIRCREWIECPDPFCRPDRPMFKGRIVDVFRRQGGRPGKSDGLSRIIKSILTPNGGMDIYEYGNTIGITPIQYEIDIIQSPLNTGFVRTVGDKLKITHG